MKWTASTLSTLYRLIVIEHKTYKQTGAIIGISEEAIRNRYKNTNWELFKKNPEQVVNPDHTIAWTEEDTLQLYVLHNRNKLSYSEIGKKLNKTPKACKSRYYRTDWSQFKTLEQYPTGEVVPEEKRQIQVEIEIAEKEAKAEQLTLYMVELARHDPKRLDHIVQKAFLKKINCEPDALPISFADIKARAKAYLETQGLCYPEEVKFGAGTYIIVGDSHGKHIKRKMFKLLHNLNRNLKPKKIIHIGHTLDDDNDISYLWEDFDNLVLLARQEELKELCKKSFKHNVVRGEIKLGNLRICNQDLIQDYVLRPIGSISRSFYPNPVVISCHRQEFDTRCTSEGFVCIASPGCLCEEHIVKTIKQMDFTDGIQIKMSYPDGFIKYRRMRHMYKFWEQGFLVVNVDRKGRFTIVPCRIHKTSKGYTTSYFDKIYTELRVLNPSEKIFINGDLHCPNHDPEILSIEDGFCKSYEPDTHVNLGDQNDNRALNHHIMKRNGWAIQESVLREMAYSHYLLSKTRKWAKKAHLLLGNHERFVRDFVGKFPQLAELLESRLAFDTEGLDIEVTNLKDTLMIGPLTLIHGDFKMYGQRGSTKLEKIGNTFGPSTVIGDCHFPSIRYGCYSVGMSGLLDQGYNEKKASKWAHGFAFCNIFDGVPFISLITLQDKQCLIGGKRIVPLSIDQWVMKDYNVQISYSF